MRTPGNTSLLVWLPRVFVGVGLALSAAACTPGESCADEPAYGGLGNDEVWLTLSDARARAEQGEDAATVVAPAANDVFLADDGAPTFQWTSPLKLAAAAGGPMPLLRRPQPRGALAAILDAAARVVVPEANAHLPPVSSDAYLVDIGVPGRACPVSIVTTELRHTLDDTTWGALQEAKGQDLSITITSGYLDTGRLTEGPYRSAAVTFRVE